MSLHYPKDADQRWQVIEGIKTPENTEVVLIVETKTDDKKFYEMQSKDCFEAEGKICELLDGRKELRDVPGMENFFMVSEEGDIFSKRTNRILKQSIHPNGYLGAATKFGGREGQDAYLKTHRLVAKAFVDNPDTKPQVNHMDGVKLNNSKTNLEWVTSQENTQHAWRTGLIKPLAGFDSTSTRLTPTDLTEIFELEGKISNRAIGRQFNVGHQSIGAILRRESFKDFVPPNT